MTIPIKIKRGLNAARTGITPVVGEPVWTTDLHTLHIGDGATAGGIEIGYLKPGDVDDTPVNGATTDPVSSNWAYDHFNANTIHIPSGGTSGQVLGKASATDYDVSWQSVTASVTMSTTAPGSPSDGALWFNTEVGNLNIWYEDGTSDQWVSAGMGGGNGGSGGGDLLADGSVPLTANWDVGSFDITAEQFHSDIVTGTSPFTVASTTVVTNLNADLLDGNEASAFETADATIVKDGDFSANGAMERTGAGTYTTILNKRDATTDPTTTDDTGSGYVVGSRWINITLDKEFICLDNTTSAAVWTETTSTGGSGDLLADGTIPLTAAWDVGAFDITAEQFHSDIVTGTSPLTVASTTVVTNLNADQVDGNDASDIVLKTDVDDTPVDAATTVPISSNWAYDYANTTAPAAYHPKGAIVGINAQTGTTYTLVAADLGKVVQCTNASAITVSVNTGVHAVDDVIYVLQNGAGQVTIAGSATVNRVSALFNAKTAGQYAMLTLTCIATNTFILSGVLEAV